MNYREYRYIPLDNGSKRPLYKFGGWPIDPDHEHVYMYEETQDIGHENWAIAGHESGELLVLDIDTYKMDDETVESIDADGWGGLLDHTTIVRSQNGGLHVYVLTNVDIYESGLEPIEHVDLKGDVGKGYAVAPFSPGYELAQDKDPMPVPPDTLESLPVLVEAVELPDFAPTGSRPWMDDEPLKAPCITVAEDEIRSRGEHFDDAISFLQKLYRNLAMTDDSIARALQESDFMAYETDRDFIHVHEVVDPSRFPEGVRVDHPDFLHDTPSESGANFMVDEDGETWRCWRHDVTGNALHLVGVKHGVIDCADWKGSKTIDSADWKRIFERARDDGIDVDSERVTCEWTRDLGLCPFKCGRPYPSERLS